MIEPTFIPEIQEDIPLSDGEKLFEKLSPTEELNMRVRTIKLLSDLSGKPLIPTQENMTQAKELAHAMVSDPSVRPDYAKYPNETLAFLAGMVARMDTQVVDDLAKIKTYVMNKLLNEAEVANSSKDRIAALKLLGEMSGVDAFVKKVEVKAEIKNITEVETRLSRILGELKIVEGEFEEKTPSKTP
jgi:hypothetical protein